MDLGQVTHDRPFTEFFIHIHHPWPKRQMLHPLQKPEVPIGPPPQSLTYLFTEDVAVGSRLIYVIWYDDRNFPGNLNTFDIYASHSTDDGATWVGPDEQVTDASTNLNIGIPTGSGWNAAGSVIRLRFVWPSRLTFG